MSDKYKEFIYPPSRVIKVSLAEFDRRIKSKSLLTWGIDEIDARINPAIPGDLITILGRPGMGKTMTGIYLMRRFSQLIRDKEVVVYATWETMIEEFAGLFSAPLSGFSLEDIGKGVPTLQSLEAALLSSFQDNIVLFGRSMDNRDNQDIPNLYDLDMALTWLRDEGYVIRALVIDYLQLIPPIDRSIQIGRSDNMVMTVTENIRQIKWLAQKHGTPVWCNAQAAREVDSYPGLKFPRMHNAQWTSAVEQTADKVLSLTMPSKYLAPDTVFDQGEYRYGVESMTLGIKLFKQRFGPSSHNDVWLTRLDPVNLSLSIQEPIGVASDTDAF